MLALPERTIIGHRSWPPPLGSNHTGILISGKPTARPTQWVGSNTARGIKVSRIMSAGDIDSSQAGPGAAMNQIGCTGTSNMKMRHPGCHHMMAWQLTATMVRGGAMWDACPPVTSHQRDQLARQMVPEVLCDGRLAHWPARGFALGTTSIATQGTTSGPGHRAMTQLRRAVCGNVFVDSLGAITFGPADLHGYTATCLFGGQEVG